MDALKFTAKLFDNKQGFIDISYVAKSLLDALNQAFDWADLTKEMTGNLITVLSVSRSK